MPILFTLIAIGGFLHCQSALAMGTGEEPENSRAVRDAKERLCGDWDKAPNTISCSGNAGVLNSLFTSVGPNDAQYVSRVKAMMETKGYPKEHCEKAVEVIWVSKHYIQESEKMRGDEISRSNALRSKISTSAENMKEIGSQIKSEADILKRRRTFFKGLQEKALAKLGDGYEFADNARVNAHSIQVDMNKITDAYARSYCDKEPILGKYRDREKKLNAMLDEVKQSRDTLRRQIADSNGYIQTFAGLEQQGAQIEQSGQALTAAADPVQPAAPAASPPPPAAAEPDKTGVVTGTGNDDRFHNIGSKEERAERVSRLSNSVTGMKPDEVQAALLNPRSPASAQLLERANNWAKENGVQPLPKVSATDNVCGERCVAVLRMMQVKQDNPPYFDMYKGAYQYIQPARLQDMYPYY